MSVKKNEFHFNILHCRIIMSYHCTICKTKPTADISQFNRHLETIKHKCKVGGTATGYVYLYTIDINGKIETYVGSCSNIEKRHRDHLNNPYNPKSNDYKSYFYTFIRNNCLNINDFKHQIVFAWTIECKGKTENKIYNELKVKEQQFMDYFKTTLNDRNSNGFDIQRYKQRHKQYYKDNKCEIHKWKNEKILCDKCGSQSTNANIAKHKQTKKCLNYKPPITININITNLNINTKKEV